MTHTAILPPATRNQARSLDAFQARHTAVAALLERLAAASADHFGADPDRVLWAEAGSLARVEELLEEAVRFIGACAKRSAGQN